MRTTDQTAPANPEPVRYKQANRFFQHWVLSPGAREIGTLYLMFAAGAGLFGLCLSIVLRLDGHGLVVDHVAEGQRWAAMAAAHGLIMIFFTVIPALFGGFGNWFVPIMIGATDTAFPRLNQLGFWFTIMGFCLLAISLFTGLHAVTVGLVVAGLHIGGVGLLACAVNFIVTILTMRAKGIELHDMTLFVWSILVAACVALLSLPILAGSLTMLWLDRGLDTAFSAPAADGEAPVQRLFWFVGHPELFVMILPAFGIVSQVIPTFSGKPIVGYLAMVYALVALGLGGFLVWGHHMFMTGLSLDTDRYYTLAGIVIAVPAGVKLFSWIATMARGSVEFETPMLFATGLIALFTVGGLAGMLVPHAGSDSPMSGAHYAVAHFHYVLSLGAVSGIFCGFYYWIGKMSGRCYPEWAGRVHFWLFFIGANLTFLPLPFLDFEDSRITGAVRGAAAYDNLASIGAGVGAVGYLWFMGLAAYTILRGRHVTEANYWGPGAKTLEWTVPTPIRPALFKPMPRIK